MPVGEVRCGEVVFGRVMLALDTDTGMREGMCVSMFGVRAHVMWLACASGGAHHAHRGHGQERRPGGGGGAEESRHFLRRQDWQGERCSESSRNESRKAMKG